MRAKNEPSRASLITMWSSLVSSPQPLGVLLAHGDAGPLDGEGIGAHAGQAVTWKRPIGDLVLTVVRIEYR